VRNGLNDLPKVKTTTKRETMIHMISRKVRTTIIYYLRELLEINLSSFLQENCCLQLQLHKEKKILQLALIQIQDIVIE
jgi:hypothetical protein